jgi:hypothetical protein
LIYNAYLKEKPIPRKIAQDMMHFLVNLGTPDHPKFINLGLVV